MLVGIIKEEFHYLVWSKKNKFVIEVIRTNLDNSFIIFKTNAPRIKEHSDQMSSHHSNIYPNSPVAEPH